MVDGRGLDKFMMKIGVVMGEVGNMRILTLVLGRKFWEKRAARKGFLLEILRGYNSLGLYSVWARRSKGVPLELGGQRDLASWQGGTNGWGWLSFRTWEGLLAAGKRKEKKTASKDSNKGGSTSYLQVFSSSIMANSVY